MEPTEAINAFEVAVRRLISDEWGSQWLAKSGFDEDKLQTNLRREQENRRAAIVSTNLLDYTEFSQLATLIRDRWSIFAPVFQGQKYITTYLGRLIHLRNGPMHSRELLPFERDQLSGMIGEILIMIAKHRSMKGPDMQHYPVIEGIVDNFGNEITAHRGQTGLRLQVGGELIFRCRATDPQGRDIIWNLQVGQMSGGMIILNEVAHGSSVDIEYMIANRDVGEDFTVIFLMSSAGQYHRNGSSDELRSVSYAVDPPLG